MDRLVFVFIINLIGLMAFLLVYKFLFDKYNKNPMEVYRESKEAFSIKKETIVIKKRKILVFSLYLYAFIVLILTPLVLFINIPSQMREKSLVELIFVYVIYVVPFLLLAILLSLWKVEVHKEYFSYWNYFGKKQDFFYKDLSDGVKNGNRWILTKNSKQIIDLQFTTTDYKALICSYYNSFADDSALPKTR